MAKKLSISLWNKFVKDLAEHLTRDNIREIKYMCKDILPYGRAETLNDGLSLLQELENQDFFDEFDVSGLEELMNEIKRKDLGKKIDSYSKNIKCRPMESDDMTLEKVSESGGYANQFSKNAKDNKEKFQRYSQKFPEDTPKLLAPEHFRTNRSYMQESTNFNSLLNVNTDVVVVNHENDEVYSMSKVPRGRCLIFSNDFEKPILMDDGSQLNKRNGTEADINSITKTFEWLDFRVEEYLNRSAVDMLDILSQVAKEDHSEFDCFVCFILSHGYEGGVFGNDGYGIRIKDIINAFTAIECKTLIKKPKLFFVQACQGPHDEKGCRPEKDSPILPGSVETQQPVSQNDLSMDTQVPSNADFFVFMATSPGTTSWRHPIDGSWFIQTVAQVIQEFASKKKPLNSMIARINWCIAKKEEEINDSGSSTAKQMSDAGRNTLTAELYFNPRVPFEDLNQQQNKLPSESVLEC